MPGPEIQGSTRPHVHTSKGQNARAFMPLDKHCVLYRQVTRKEQTMVNAFSVLQTIAEERIREAQEQGVFDNLPGQGAPLKESDDSNIPEELRMAYHILKNAGCVPPEVEERKQIAALSDMLDRDSDEHTKLQQMRTLEAMVLHCQLRSGRSLAVHAADDVYLDRILEKIRLKRAELRK